MDPFITNLRYSPQVVIKPGRASEQTKLDLVQLDPSKNEALRSLPAGTQDRWVIETY